VQGFTVEGLHPWEAILDHAKAQACDVIVMASHGRRGMTRCCWAARRRRC
jgi:nucleotide-binding universal stress UspA family protein